jgi:hypothetical protein
MAELEARAPVPLGLSEVLTEKRLRIAAICVALFVVTFAVYWRLSPQETAYSHQVNQANNIIHGHLDMDPQYTRNYNTLERVLYDGHRFCFSPGDPQASLVENPPFSPTCKTYMQHSLGPAFVVIPGVLIWGNELNQTLVSVIFGAMTAPIVFLIAARFSKKLLNQLLMTALMIFGTIFFHVATNGGVWMFAHTTAVFFLFAAIYFVVARPIPVGAGAMLGAAFLCRGTVLMTGGFFLVAFIPLWLKTPSENNGRWGLNPIPLLNFAAGLAPFLALEGLVNYLRFENPLETGYGYTEQTRQTYLQFVYPHGLFDISYMKLHPKILFEAMPIFNKSGTACGNPGQECAPVVTSGSGMAIWMTTPVFLMSVFTGVTNKWVTWIGAMLLALSCAFIFSRAFSRLWDSSWQTQTLPFGSELLPFWGMIAIAVAFSIKNRDRLVFACWLAIIPTALVIFTFAATGWSQFGYRYSLDFMPFIWLLIVRSIGDDLKWWHVALIVAGIVVNLCGVLWIYHFQPNNTHDWVWMTS